MNTSGENRTRIFYLEDRNNDHYTTLAIQCLNDIALH